VTTHLGLQRIMIPGAQASALTTGSISLAGARQPFIPPGDYESISSYVVPNDNVFELSFNGIPSTYKHLQLRMTSTNNNTGGWNQSTTQLRFNSDYNSNYSGQQVYYYNSSDSGSFTNTNTTGTTSISAHINNGATYSHQGVSIVDIYDYTSTAKFKPVVARFGISASLNTVNNSFQMFGGWSWKSTSAITSVQIRNASGDTYKFKAGSTFALYGLK
jgi:hypothetical protein